MRKNVALLIWAMNFFFGAPILGRLIEPSPDVIPWYLNLLLSYLIFTAFLFMTCFLIIFKAIYFPEVKKGEQDDRRGKK